MMKIVHKARDVEVGDSFHRLSMPDASLAHLADEVAKIVAKANKGVALVHVELSVTCDWIYRRESLVSGDGGTYAPGFRASGFDLDVEPVGKAKAKTTPPQREE